MKNHAFGSGYQQGMVLVIGLIFLLLMTIIGVTSIQTTTLDERMAENLRNRNVAFQGAEAALRAGEAWLLASTVNQNTARANPDIADPASWDGLSNPNPTGTVDTSDDSIWSTPPAADPAFFVGPPIDVRGPGIVSGQPSDEVFPVYAYSQGATNTAVVMLRTYYKPN